MAAITPPGAASERQIGHYQVLGKIGEGGMGEVYRARDTRLNREVALKVLPQAFADDPYRMARFQREAQLLASLNHPNIAAIYGLEESGATRALIMELVEGPTLAERIGRAAQFARPKASSASLARASAAAGSGKSGEQVALGGNGRSCAIPLEEALPIAQQMAEALEYAHEQGIIHRDLKPANVKVTPDGCVKVLDFGLAKAMEQERGSADIANSPTLSVAMTQAGFILGTAAYMSPEQAKGKSVDRRADIWAFGCVLYEMLSGQKPFEGESVADVLATVIKSEPDWSALPAETPAGVRRLIRRCLAKDPKQRLHDIGDARLAIEDSMADDIAAGVVAAQKPESKRSSLLRRAMPWVIAALGIVLAAAITWFAFRPKPQHGVIRFAIPQPENGKFIYGGMPSVSPDGRMVAFIADPAPGKPRVLWLRTLDSVVAEPIAGTDGAAWPFWSPDGQQIGFFVAGKLEVVSRSGGVPETLCSVQVGIGATWNRDGVIVFSSAGDLYRVQDTGGMPTLVAAAAPPSRYLLPQFLPDGHRFLYFVMSTGQIAVPGAAESSVRVASLDSSKPETLLNGTSNALFVQPGYLFYEEAGNLMARAFDASSLKFTAQAVRVAENVNDPGRSWTPFSVSGSGTLVYRIASDAEQSEMTWFDSSGQKLGTIGSPGTYGDPVVSPDGSRLVVVSASPSGGTSDIWAYDLKLGTGSRLTFTAAKNTSPVWSLDGTSIFYSSLRNGLNGIYKKAADGMGSEQLVFQSAKQDVNLDSLSPDGRFAMYMSHTPNEGDWVVPLSGDQKPFPYLQGSFDEGQAEFSPNGRYVAYFSTETGRPEIYVQTFPEHQGKWQISTAGGMEPIWRADGKQLFYVTGAGETMSVDVTTDSDRFRASPPKVVFKQQRGVYGGWRNVNAVSPDGKRFLLLVSRADARSEPLTVVLDWPTLLKK